FSHKPIVTQKNLTSRDKNRQSEHINSPPTPPSHMFFTGKPKGGLPEQRPAGVSEDRGRYSGFWSTPYYESGLFQMKIKLPDKDSAGVNRMVTFSVRNLQ
ncbi:hypothetical protein M8C21_012652, partial [Ambrosia artemisiifolia]